MVKFTRDREGGNMKPRIFVSSTFYDLKYIREDLANFIRAHDFEPIMFEDGDIGYTPGKELDMSCYETMKSSDMVVLIIGGNYGSKASGEKEKFDSYMSVTKKEFKTAVESRIPIFVFVDSKVLTEYETFDLNQSILRQNSDAIKFKNTKNINVFYFIKEIYQLGNLPVTSFTRSEDIKSFLSKQWSDMFKKYLQGLKDEKINDSLNGTISGMKMILNQMTLMVNKIGEKTMNEDELESILDKQNKIKVQMVADLIVKSFTVEVNDNFSNNIKKAKEKNIDSLLNFITNISPEDNVWEVMKNSGISYGAAKCSLNLIIANKDMIMEVISDAKCCKFLKSILASDKYYNRIFPTDIKTVIPDFYEYEEA